MCSMARCFISFNSEIGSKVIWECFGNWSCSYRAAVGKCCCLRATVPFLCPIPFVEKNNWDPAFGLGSFSVRLVAIS